jgi:hypothetical protein
MRCLTAVIGLLAVMAGPAEAQDPVAQDAAVQDADETAVPRPLAQRTLAVTLDAGSLRRFPEWLRNLAFAREFKVTLYWESPIILYFSLEGEDTEILGINEFDMPRFAVEFHGYGAEAAREKVRIQGLADDFSRHFQTRKGIAVSPSFPVWQTKLEQRNCELVITLEEGAGERFLDRVRAFARKHDFVATGRARPNLGVSFQLMTEALGIIGGNRLRPVEFDSLPSEPGEGLSYSADPLAYNVSCYENRPPKAVPGDGAQKLIDEFIASMNETDGVTVSEAH